MTLSPSWVAEAIRYGQDAESGAEIEQLTSEPVTSTNIYCEQRYTSADGARIALERRPFGRPAELWVCDLRSLRLARAATGRPLAANSVRNAVYYLADEPGGVGFRRLDLVGLESRELYRFDDRPAVERLEPRRLRVQHRRRRAYLHRRGG